MFPPDFTFRVKNWFLPPKSAEKRPNHGKIGWNCSSFDTTVNMSVLKIPSLLLTSTAQPLRSLKQTGQGQRVASRIASNRSY
jgi:hypothetical protein